MAQANKTKTNNKPARWDEYRLAIENHRHTEEHRLTFLYYYLVASSMLILAWATVSAANWASPYAKHDVLSALSIFGMVTSSGWMLVAYRAGRYHEASRDMVMDAQSRLQLETPNESRVTRLIDVDREVRESFDRWPFKWILRPFGTASFTMLLPLAFSVLYLFLLMRSAAV